MSHVVALPVPSPSTAVAVAGGSYAAYEVGKDPSLQNAIANGLDYAKDKVLDGVEYIRDRTVEAAEHVGAWATGFQNVVSNDHYAVPEDRIQESLNSADREDRNDRSRIGRSWEKKGGREGSIYPKPKGGPREINDGGRKILEEILRDPEAKIRPNKSGGEDIIDSIGRGARFDRDGEFDTLLEP